MLSKHKLTRKRSDLTFVGRWGAALRLKSHKHMLPRACHLPARLSARLAISPPAMQLQAAACAPVVTAKKERGAARVSACLFYASILKRCWRPPAAFKALAVHLTAASGAPLAGGGSSARRREARPQQRRSS